MKMKLNSFKSLREKYKKKMIRNSFLRQSLIRKNNLYIDNQETKIKVCWLKNNNYIQDYLYNYSEIDYHLCFLVNLRTNWSSINFKSKFDLVIVGLNWIILKTYYSFPTNRNIELNQVCHIFLLTPGTIENYDIKVGQRFCPMYKSIL